MPRDKGEVIATNNNNLLETFEGIELLRGLNKFMTKDEKESLEIFLEDISDLQIHKNGKIWRVNKGFIPPYYLGYPHWKIYLWVKYQIYPTFYKSLSNFYEYLQYIHHAL